MKLRSLLLSGSIICAGLFFPYDTFAEKPDQAQKAIEAKEIVETMKDLDSISNASSDENSKKLEPKQPVKEVVEKAVPTPAQASEKAGQKDTLPEIANEKAQQAVQESKQKNEKVLKVIHTTEKETNQTVKKTVSGQNKEKTQTSEKQKETSKDASMKVKSFEESAQPVGKKKSAERTSPKILNRSEEDQTVKTMKESNDVAKDKPEVEEKKNLPSIPDNGLNAKVKIYSLTNQKAQDGPSKDRSGNGSYTSSIFDKFLLESEKYLSLKRIQPFISRQFELRNQWDHAPPSPPPQKSSFI
ncbi:MAG TPA: hypothetical protein VEY70_13050 [Metabacillus sp.]|nr:hypothetical protein [Metabacillus sp.]